jgi:predicted transcriptional regulator
VADADDIRSPADEDATIESAVLQQLLALHPTLVTVEELMREIAPQPGDFSERDAVERALRDLAAAGLVHRNDDFVLPSRAALRFDELLGG